MRALVCVLRRLHHHRALRVCVCVCVGWKGGWGGHFPLCRRHAETPRLCNQNNNNTKTTAKNGVLPFLWATPLWGCPQPIIRLHRTVCLILCIYAYIICLHVLFHTHTKNFSPVSQIWAPPDCHSFLPQRVREILLPQGEIK